MCSLNNNLFKRSKVKGADTSTPSLLIIVNHDGTFEWNARLDKLISMCERETCPLRQRLLKHSSHIYTANSEEWTENECEIEKRLHCSRIFRVKGGVRRCVQLAIRTTVYTEESAHSPYCQLWNKWHLNWIIQSGGERCGICTQRLTDR